MKFGLLLPNYGHTASTDFITRSAALAEAQGYDSVWTTDHVVVPKEQSIPYGNLLESLVALTLAATATHHVKLGTSIIVLPQREPILLAKQLAAIDFLSHGRLILGVGVGWLENEFRFLGADFHRRGRVFEEYLRVLKALWGGDTDFQGEYVSFQQVVFSPLPPQRSQIPIWIAGNSDSAIRRAAQLAKAWHPVGLGPEEFSRCVSALKAASKHRNVMLTLRSMVSFPGVGGVEQQANPTTLERSFVFQGNPKEMKQSLAEFQEAGLEYLLVWFFHDNWDQLEYSITTFAQEVMPTFA
jgi:probable F420-dependent oxidoreductase